MSHAETILRTLDRHFSRETSLILYGRAALVLGFPDPPPEVAASLDVDIILPHDRARARMRIFCSRNTRELGRGRR